jgi:nickel/cobalt transporter (NiCoT) family protein
MMSPCLATQETDFPGRRAILVIGALLVVNAVVWLIAVLTYTKFMPNSVALLIVSYALGLRHALDADHIAAIDNVTRRLMQENLKPVTVGLFFSLGHSTIVIIATSLVAGLSSAIESRFNSYGEVSSIIGPSISATFLLLVGTINGVSAYFIVRDIKSIKSRGPDETFDWNVILENSGFFSRVFGKRLFKVIDRPYKMYFVGFLFGLGFDTASEVALLGIAAIQAANGANVWLILLLPILFTCGMTLIDTTDGILMLGAYGWASITPSKKLYYNLVITLVSCFFAVFIALLEFFGIIQTVCNLGGEFWDFVSSATDSSNFGAIGIALLASFMAGWILSRLFYHWYATPDSLDVISGHISNEQCVSLHDAASDNDNCVSVSAIEGYPAALNSSTPHDKSVAGLLVSDPDAPTIMECGDVVSASVEEA